jgi:hypothetical protein
MHSSYPLFIRSLHIHFKQFLVMSSTYWGPPYSGSHRKLMRKVFCEVHPHCSVTAILLFTAVTAIFGVLCCGFLVHNCMELHRSCFWNNSCKMYFNPTSKIHDIGNIKETWVTNLIPWFNNWTSNRKSQGSGMEESRFRFWSSATSPLHGQASLEVLQPWAKTIPVLWPMPTSRPSLPPWNTACPQAIAAISPSNYLVLKTMRSPPSLLTSHPRQDLVMLWSCWTTAEMLQHSMCILAWT